MKKIKKTLLYLFGFAALLLVITVVINSPAFDEELLPEVAAIKNIKAEPFARDNAYLALLAINGPSGKTLQQATEEVRSFLNQKIAETGLDFLNEEEYQNLIGKGHDVVWKNTYKSCVSRTEKSCLFTLAQELTVNPIINPRLIEQLNRYQDLIQMTGFNDVTQMDVTAPLTAFSPVMNIKRLFLTDAFINKSSDEYLVLLNKDLTLWRKILKNSHFMITKMIAIASLHDDVGSLSTAIKQGYLSPIQLNQIQGSLLTLKADESGMGQVFDFEFKYGMSLFDTADAASPIGISEWFNFYQPRATHNTTYSYGFKPLKNVTSLNTAEFYQYLESDQPAEDFASPVKWSPSMLYNPVGKILVGYAIPAYTDYIARVHDLNGMFYLLKLQIEIGLNPDRAVEQVITNSQYTNPYTLKPMAYNSESHSIYFECMDKTSSCELDL